MSITNELLAHMSYTAAVQKNNLREQLDSDLEAFLKNGGQVETLPRGYSGERSKFNSRPVGGTQKSQKVMRNVMAASVAAAQARRNNPNVVARQKAKDEGEKYFHGAECVSCNKTHRYTSNNVCVTCSREASVRRSKKQQTGEQHEKAQ